MIKITFVCYGNICRSPLAEFLFNDFIKDAGLSGVYRADSAATSNEETGNPVYPPVKRILTRMGIDCEGKRSVQLKAEDYPKSDLLIGMDERNVRDMARIFGGDAQGKIKKLLYFAGDGGDVADPYWTGDYEKTFMDVVRGVKGLIEVLQKEKTETRG